MVLSADHDAADDALGCVVIYRQRRVIQKQRQCGLTVDARCVASVSGVKFTAVAGVGNGVESSANSVRQCAINAVWKAVSTIVTDNGSSAPAAGP